MGDSKTTLFGVAMASITANRHLDLPGKDTVCG